MNVSDAERLRTSLEQSGYEPTDKEQNADLIALVACSVRQSAVDRIYGRAKRWQEWKQTRPLTTVLTGCVLEHDKKKLRGVFDYFFPITNTGRISQILAQKKGAEKNALGPTEYFSLSPKHSSTFQAFVPVSTGCNKFCSYCAVPYTRGREVSRDPEEIINEVNELVNRGYREITLLGQNVNSYGHDFRGVALNLPGRQVFKYQRGQNSRLEIQKRLAARPMNFPELLQSLASLPGEFWLRFITSHPYDMSDELIKTIAQHKKITPYLHLPIQSGSDRVLKAMNRLYTVEQYRERIQKIRELIPDVVLTTDIIVGFPGETLADFEKTCLVVKELHFDLAYIAQYSARPGTKAAEMYDSVPRLEKKRREKVLTEVLKNVAGEKNQRLIGTLQEVLFDQYKNGFAYGKTYGGKNLRVKSKNDLSGTFRTVEVTGATSWHLSGKLA